MSRRTSALRKLVAFGSTEGEREAARIALSKHQPPVAYHAHDAEGMADTARVVVADGDAVHRWLRSTEPVVVRWETDDDGVCTPVYAACTNGGDTADQVRIRNSALVDRIQEARPKWLQARCRGFNFFGSFS